MLDSLTGSMDDTNPEKEEKEFFEGIAYVYT
jgi:hypothetical protein